MSSGQFNALLFIGLHVLTMLLAARSLNRWLCGEITLFGRVPSRLTKIFMIWMFLVIPGLIIIEANAPNDDDIDVEM